METPTLSENAYASLKPNIAAGDYPGWTPEEFGFDALGRNTEVYILNTDGNRFAVIPRAAATRQAGDHPYVVVDRNDNLRRLAEGGHLEGREVPQDELRETTLRVGATDPTYGTIREITVVDTSRKLGEGEKPDTEQDIRQIFWDGLRPDATSLQKPESKTAEIPSITYDDEKLVDLLLEGGEPNYSRLLGDDLTSQERWEPANQLKAREGMAELFRTALPSVDLEGMSVEEIRTKLGELSEDSWQRLAQRGEGLHYQLTRHTFDQYYHSKYIDFLHFGPNVRYPDAPDKLPAKMRVYVNTKLEAAGHVAARVIAIARGKGYTPYGKVIDLSSSSGALSTREDRLLFYTSIQSHLDIIQDALEQVHAEEPELFEDHPPLLSEPTDTPGVGLAEEPPNDDIVATTFNDSRVGILREAWHKALSTILGDTQELDSRKLAKRCQAAITSGQIQKQALIDLVRKEVHEISPKHGVSQDNFARNAPRAPTKEI